MSEPYAVTALRADMVQVMQLLAEASTAAAIANERADKRDPDWYSPLLKTRVNLKVLQDILSRIAVSPHLPALVSEDAP